MKVYTNKKFSSNLSNGPKQSEAFTNTELVQAVAGIALFSVIMGLIWFVVIPVCIV